MYNNTSENSDRHQLRYVKKCQCAHIKTNTLHIIVIKEAHHYIISTLMFSLSQYISNAALLKNCHTTLQTIPTADTRITRGHRLKNHGRERIYTMETSLPSKITNILEWFEDSELANRQEPSDSCITSGVGIEFLLFQPDYGCDCEGRAGEGPIDNVICRRHNLVGGNQRRCIGKVKRVEGCTEK